MGVLYPPVFPYETLRKKLIIQKLPVFSMEKNYQKFDQFFSWFFPWKKLEKTLKSFFLKVSSFLSFIDLTSRRAVQNRNFDEICNEGRSRFF